jgi:ABC-type uncharacterized transport system substrate-binding protein
MKGCSSCFLSLLTLLVVWVTVPTCADVLVIVPENPKALALANEISRQISDDDTVVSSDPEALADPDLIITVGTAALKQHRTHLTAPTIAAFVSPHDFEGLDHTIAVPTAPVYATAEPDQVVDFLSRHFPGARVGYVYEATKDPYLVSMELASRKHPVAIVPIKLQGDIFKTYRRVFRKKSVDVMLITNSANLYTAKNIRFVLESLYRERIPAIGLNKQIVKAGALAAVYTDTQDVIAVAVNQANTYIAQRHFGDTRYVVNHNVLSHRKLAEEFELHIQGAHYLE